MAGDLQSERATWFRSLEPVMPQEMVGFWRGVGLASGHPLDGVLENLQWFGKRFHSDMRADALLFQARPGRLVALEPAFFPVRLALKVGALGRTSAARNLFSHIQKALRAKGTTASLRLATVDGLATAAMAYDRQPITDFFRKAGDDELAGMMCVEGDARRYFFILRRAEMGNPLS